MHGLGFRVNLQIENYTIFFFNSSAIVEDQRLGGAQMIRIGNMFDMRALEKCSDSKIHCEVI